MRSDKLKVFLTVDTEIWPFAEHWPVVPLTREKRQQGFAREIDFYLDGRTSRGAFGLPFQLSTLTDHGLRGVFFIEALCADVMGPSVLARMVELVQNSGHDAQLHLHTEWLREISLPELPGFQQHIRQFPEEDQVRIIRRGLANLRAAGAQTVNAFRAGNYGANTTTLRALARNGVVFDSTYNAAYLGDECQIDPGSSLVQPRLIDGVLEIPVSTFHDYPGHLRPAQLCACSFGEMKAVLLKAWEAGWYSFVIVWHGQELLRRRRDKGEQSASRINVRRFEQLCGFLAENQDKFSTMSFSELDPAKVPRLDTAQEIDSTLTRTARRVAEQVIGRCF